MTPGLYLPQGSAATSRRERIPLARADELRLRMRLVFGLTAGYPETDLRRVERLIGC